MKCVRFQRGLIVAKDIGRTKGAIARGYHMRSRLSVPHSQSGPSIHPRWRPNPEIEWHHHSITSIHAGPPRKTHGTDFDKRHD